MDLDELKQTWKKVNQNQSVYYSTDQINSFRKSRSKDFSNWIRSSIRTDIFLKTLIALSFLVLAFLFRQQVISQIVFVAISIISGILIYFERPHYLKIRDLENNQDTLQNSLISKLNFLKSYYFKIQFLVGLTNPLLVASGASYYMYFKYQEIRPMDFEDILVFSVVLIVAFLFTIPTTAGLYGFHLKNIQNSLANLENDEHWAHEIKRYKKSRLIIGIVFISLLILGIISLIVILLR